MPTYEELMERAKDEYNASMEEANELYSMARRINPGLSEESELLDRVVDIRLAARQKLQEDNQHAVNSLRESNGT